MNANIRWFEFFPVIGLILLSEDRKMHWIEQELDGAHYIVGCVQIFCDESQILLTAGL